MKNICRRILADLKNNYIAILLIIITYILITNIFGAFCPSVIVTGLPCPGCGMTRAVIAIFTGRFEAAMHYNPVAILWLLWALYFVISRYIIGKPDKWISHTLSIICIITIIIYVIRMVMYFPDETPMTYYKNNIMSKIVALYKSIW